MGGLQEEDNGSGGWVASGDGLESSMLRGLQEEGNSSGGEHQVMSRKLPV